AQPCAAATPSAMRRIASSIARLTCGEKLRQSPRMRAVPGSTLRVPSVRSSVAETTAVSPGSSVRETIVCSAVTMAQAVTSAAFAWCGRAAPPLLGRLEEEVHGAVEAPLGGEDLRRSEQHGGVAVVAAGGHP